MVLLLNVEIVGVQIRKDRDAPTDERFPSAAFGNRRSGNWSAFFAKASPIFVRLLRQLSIEFKPETTSGPSGNTKMKAASDENRTRSSRRYRVGHRIGRIPSESDNATYKIDGHERQRDILVCFSVLIAVGIVPAWHDKWGQQYGDRCEDHDGHPSKCHLANEGLPNHEAARDQTQQSERDQQNTITVKEPKRRLREVVWDDDASSSKKGAVESSRCINAASLRGRCVSPSLDDTLPQNTNRNSLALSSARQRAGRPYCFTNCSAAVCSSSVGVRRNASE